MVRIAVRMPASILGRGQRAEAIDVDVAAREHHPGAGAGDVRAARRALGEVQRLSRTVQSKPARAALLDAAQQLKAQV